MARIPSHTTSLVYLMTTLVLAILFRTAQVDSFLLRSTHSSSSFPTARRISRANHGSSFRAIKETNIVSVTDSNYRELFRGEKFLLLDAFAQWCGPCKLVEPTLELCAREWEDSVVVGKFDVDDTNGKNSKSRDLKIELILQGVMPRRLPALILVHKNQVLDTWKGVISPTQLHDMLEKHVENKNGGTSNPKFDNGISNEGRMFCENGVCKMRPKTASDLNNSKPRPFRGIGLINNL